MKSSINALKRLCLTWLLLNLALMPVLPAHAWSANSSPAATAEAAAEVAAAAAARNGRIAFVSNRDGNLEIYTMNPDGSGVRRLTNNTVEDTDPAWSPDGSRIAFTSRRDGSRDIYVMNSDGTNVVRLTNRFGPTDLSTYFQPAWSPDGSRIAFVKDPNLRGNQPGIYVMNADGSNPQQLTEHTSLNDMPSWSPDGKQIAFRSNRQGNRSDIYVMNSDGTAQTLIPTPGLSVVEHPAWSPDGKRIAFNGVSVNNEGGLHIIFLELNNSFGRVAGTSFLDSQPAWSPDGELLAFLRYGSGDGDIFITDMKGGPAVRVANSPQFDGLPDWQKLGPGNGRIAFLSARDGNDEIYTMRADGAEQTNLTHTVVNETTHAWSPDGSRIAFLREQDDNLYVMNSDGTGLVKITNNDFQHIRITNLTWSPDGSKIAYVSGSDLVHYLTVVNTDGTNKRHLLEFNAPYLDIAWSPDGARIAFSLGYSFNLSDIWVMNADGSGVTRFTTDADAGKYNRSPSWSPDGTRIAFESNRDGNDEIYVLYLQHFFGDPTTEKLQRLTNNPARDVDPTWSPDGSRIAFSTDRDGNDEIYTMNSADGGALQRLTDNAAADTQPEWQSVPAPAPRPADTAQFSTVVYKVFEDGSSETSRSGLQITVTRLGLRAAPLDVTFETSDGTASSRTDYTPVRGTLHFETGQATKTFNVPVTYDSFIEGNETVNLTLTSALYPGQPVQLGTQNKAQLIISESYPLGGPPPNAIDISENFVRQHYHDFLNREPDPEGLSFWTRQITACGSDAACIARKRIDVSGAFFLSIEFQETGYFLYRLHVLTFGTLPRFADFLRDTQRLGRDVIVNQGNWQQQLEQNKFDFSYEWVQRPGYIATCGGKTPREFVDFILSHVQFTVSAELRNSLVADLEAGRKTQADVLRTVVELEAFKQSEKNRAFVLMQYFGYLRRNPDDPPEETRDFTGYNFWLTKLNNHGGDYRSAEMVKAFIISGEYRGRFGQ